MHEQKVIALLDDSTGVTAKAASQIFPLIGRGKSLIVTDRDPERLVQKALVAHQQLTTSAKKLTFHRVSPLCPKLLDSHNVFALFATDDGLSERQATKVRTLVDLIAQDRTQTRAPLVVASTRGGFLAELLRRAQEQGTKTIGVSPQKTRRAFHQAAESAMGLDQVYLTAEGPGAGELASYRHTIEKANVVFVAGGDYQTLGGTVFAMYQPTVVAILESGGLAGKLRRSVLSTFDKPAHARMIYDSDPARLYRRAMIAAEELRRTPKVEYVAPE
jgi:hypothetical protein